MSLAESLLAWLPAKNRVVELLVVGIFGTTAVIYLAYVESKNLDELRILTSDLIQLDHEVRDMARDQAAPGIIAGLLSFLRCDSPPEIRESAIALLYRISPHALDNELKPVLQACPVGSSVLVGAANDASERKFLRGVQYGRDFYRDRLWQAAADEWHSAANGLQPSDLEKKGVTTNDFRAASAAYDARDYLSAADYYIRAYSNVPTVR